MTTEPKKGIATFIKQLPLSSPGNVKKALYKLNPPIEDWDSYNISYEYVVVSSVVARGTGPETFIFPSSPKGKVIGYLELPGSLQGTLELEDALKNAGYQIENGIQRAVNIIKEGEIK